MAKTATLLETKRLENTIIVDNRVRFSFQYSTYDWTKKQVREMMDDLIMIYGQLEDDPDKSEDKTEDIPF